uniref:TGS domain-containing protein n=1 Tax=Dendroctonus ponderosae TaxID=77166 RepID=J3JZA1_DENPD|nr:unknown [Dendroctonus ponderosae]
MALNSFRSRMGPKLINSTLRRCLSSSVDELERQCKIFAFEKNRQQEAVGRVEKIEVQHENDVFVMNRNISTPFDCAKHLGEMVRERSVVGLMNGKTLWHMHKPLPDSCVLELLHHHVPNPQVVNKVFWRTCSFLLGAVVSQAFKDNVQVHLHSFPSPNVKSGSFIYDVQLGLSNWEPTVAELKVLSLEFIKFCQKEQPIECLDVNRNTALEIFENNPHKSQQIPDIAAHNSNKVTLFKVGSHIDISRGPMLPNTNQMGRVTVTNAIKLDTDIKEPIYRFQGVALPRSIRINHFAYSLIEDRGRILNSGRIPSEQGTFNEDNTFVAHLNQ